MQAWIGCWLLMLLPLSAWSQFKDNYVVRSQSSLNSAALASTSGSQCYATGVKGGVMVQVLCKKNGDIIKGWVSRKAVETSVTRVRTSSLRPRGTRFAAARTSPRLGAEIVNDFMSVIYDNSPKRIKETRVVNRKSRRRASVNLLQLPTYPAPSGQGVQMACGSQHIRNDRSSPYATPLTSCLITGVAQEWRQRFCPDNNPDCRMMIGDGSHGAKLPKEWPHVTHRDGTCFDIWPIRKAGGGLKEVDDYNDPVYSRERTRELVKLLQKWGSDKPGGGKGVGNQLFFNDSKLRDNGKRLTRSIRNHDGHIHVCFRDNAANRKRCEEAKFDTKLCPGLVDPKVSPGIYAEELRDNNTSARSKL